MLLYNILHGSWLPAHQRFFVWAETWRRLEEAVEAGLNVESHLYCLSADEFQSLIDDVPALNTPQAQSGVVLDGRSAIEGKYHTR